MHAGLRFESCFHSMVEIRENEEKRKRYRYHLLLRSECGENMGICIPWEAIGRKAFTGGDDCIYTRIFQYTRIQTDLLY